MLGWVFTILTSWGAIVFSLITAGVEGGLDLVQEYISLSSLRCLPSLNFLLCLQLVKKFVVWWWCGVVGGWWLKPILVFSLAEAEQYLKSCGGRRNLI